VKREETLSNVIKSVTRNGRSIILTAVLALILVYIFSVIGFVFFKDDFLIDVDDVTLRKYYNVGNYSVLRVRKKLNSWVFLAETVFKTVSENVTENLANNEFGSCAADGKNCNYEESPANKYKVAGESYY